MQPDAYILTELKSWQHQMQKRPTLVDALSKSVQNRINAIIPEKVHTAITTVIKKMVQGVLFGAQYTSPKPPPFNSFTELEAAVDRRIEFYKNAAAAEGGITGAGGFLAAMADFPLLLSLKLKLLFDIAALYGYDVKDYKERLYILHIFGIAFSSQKHRRAVYYQMEGWDDKKAGLPDNVSDFEWRSFQQEYRDYIDLAKLAQMIPGVGAVVGFVVNYRMLKKLGLTAKNAYRMRLVQQLEKTEKATTPAGKH